MLLSSPASQMLSLQASHRWGILPQEHTHILVMETFPKKRAYGSDCQETSGVLYWTNVKVYSIQCTSMTTRRVYRDINIVVLMLFSGRFTFLFVLRSTLFPKWCEQFGKIHSFYSFYWFCGYQSQVGAQWEDLNLKWIPTSFFCCHKEQMHRIQGEGGHGGEEDPAERESEGQHLEYSLFVCL